jgi:uncharacterized membrane protein
MSAIVLIHLASTWYMAGLIWLVQLVHYPMFEQYDEDAFIAAMVRHQRQTTWAVAPAMFIELLTAAWLAWQPPDPGQRGWWLLGLALVGVNAFSTALLQVPCHRRLLKGYDAAVHRRLVTGNWVRTLAWSARGLLVLALAR